LFSAVVLLIVSAGPAGAAEDSRVVPLPDDFQPEGIATHGRTFYVGSIPTGAIYRGDLKTGEGDIFVPPMEGRAAIGLSLHKGVLFVAGGPTGDGYAYSADTGEELGVFELTTDPTFVNDVVATGRAAYFTDSLNQRLYKVPIERGGGFGDPETLPLTGDIQYTDGFNANGIDATPNGKTLFLVQSNTGQLFTVDPMTGVATEIDLGGATVPMGDGILLDRGLDLWVVQNRVNLLTLVRLDPGLTSGTVVNRFTDETFDVPTTIARAGGGFALVNARFGTMDPPPVPYWVSVIRRPA
jgi:sugar lactone lactonase YvrE